jgi:predicted ester cyclase
MGTEENKQLVRRFVEEVCNQDKLDVIDEIYAPVHRTHACWPNPVRLDSNEAPSETSTPADLKHNAALGRAGFSDLHYTLDEIVAEGDRVRFAMTTRGTHTGPLHGIAATGKSLWWTTFGTVRVEHGKIAETWVLWDRLGYFQQLGLVPDTRALLRSPVAS